MYRFLLTPRWLALHVVVLLVIPAFVLLGQWQFGRYEVRSAASDRTSANVAAPTVPLAELTSVGGAVREADKFRTVTVRGSFDPAQELLVRRRTQNREVGFYVLTPLKTDTAAVLVNRGWVKAGTDADGTPEVPPPPAGEVKVTGRLRPAETEESTGISDRQGLAPRQILLINGDKLGLPYPLYGGFVELTHQEPAAAVAPEPVPEPDLGNGGGLNLAYGVQWWLFIGIAIGGWLMLIRREARDLRAAADRLDERSGEGAERHGDDGQADGVQASDAAGPAVTGRVLGLGAVPERTRLE
ncbi:SURF1 family cytochrome oxidase biogenesis protein [Acrocarpospora catenulata]|uniref:SURF1 family cytochrome oxidase biogenesis protein n=1 Tax=Acrocarpospora catenulata TaxID=2836182 RepID=UPI001BD9AE4C|nr:SURF1 family protein [Acrocarpospora catenulata]